MHTDLDNYIIYIYIYIFKCIKHFTFEAVKVDFSYKSVAQRFLLVIVALFEFPEFLKYFKKLWIDLKIEFTSIYVKTNVSLYYALFLSLFTEKIFNLFIFCTFFKIEFSISLLKMKLPNFSHKSENIPLRKYNNKVWI